MKEVWLNIGCLKGYMISNYGRIKSLDRFVGGKCNSCRLIKGKIISGYDYSTDYKRANIHGKSYRVHRLMAEAFLEIPEHLKHLPTEKLQVNHKDENKLNNFIYVNEDGSVDYDKSNLEWCDNKYNNNYGTKNQRMTNTKIEKGIVDEKYFK